MLGTGTPRRGNLTRAVVGVVTLLVLSAAAVAIGGQDPAGAERAAPPAAVAPPLLPADWVPPLPADWVPPLPADWVPPLPPLPEPPPPPTTLPLRPISVAFLGDSVASSTAQALAPHAGAHAVQVLNDGIWGCGVVRGVPFRYFGMNYRSLPNDCDHWPEQWHAAMDAQRPDVAVVMVGRWELMDRVHEGAWTHIGVPAFDAYLAWELDQAVAAAGSRGSKVVVASTPYYRRGDAPGGGTFPEDDPARVDRVNQLLRELVFRHPGVGFVDYGALLSPGGGLAMEIDGVRVRTDGVHVAAESGPWMAPRLLPGIRAAAGY